eukprot:9461997-Karenia_brevis.AAC.1
MLDSRSCACWLYRVTSKIATAAKAHDVHKFNASWKSWLSEGPSRGIGRQHRMSRTSVGWIASPVASHAEGAAEGETLEQFDDVDGLAESMLQNDT